MYEYSIFWVKEEIANHYFHKSDILYRFIKNYQTNSEREDLQLQYDYITKHFPQDVLISHVKNYYKHGVMLQFNGSQIKIYKDINYISLHISEKHLKFRCKTLQDAEELLFPMLRQFQPLLFIIGNNLENFGWISPVINTSKYQSDQVLYSFL